MTDPHATYQYGRHSFEWGDPERAILELDYVRENRGEITAEVSATSTVPTGGLVHVARVNLLSTRSLSEYAGHVAKRAPATGADWQQVVAIAARETVTRFRRGEPSILLRDHVPAQEDPRVLPPLVLRRLPTIIFGDGGAAKSMIALAAAASIQSGVPYLGLQPTTTANVLYLDYEFDADEHHKRLARLCGDDAPAVVYQRYFRPLADEVDRVRAEIIRRDIGFLVIDSVANACDGPPEAAEVATRFWAALRELDLGALLVAHVNRSGDTERPFGSAFWHNGARLTWYAKLEAEIGDATTVGLFSKKANTGPRPAPLGFRVDWGERIAIARTDVRDIPDISKHVPVTFRIADVIRAGAMTAADIASEVDATVDTVSRTLRRMRERAQVREIVGPDGITRWGLAA